MSKPIVAIVGRPNVGKSTLFNRLTGSRLAIVEDEPGVTRDRIYADVEWLNKTFTIIDTGGIQWNEDKISEQIKYQAEIAIEEADLILFVTDGKAGLVADDQEVATILRRTKKPVVLAVNKIDNFANNNSYNFYELGLGEPIPISSIHGMNTGDLLDEIVKALPRQVEFEEEEDLIKVAVVGRPNVGKSSLINHIFGEKRVIVSDIAGTTRDAIDLRITWNKQKFTFIDTAGMRKRSKIYDAVEKYSIIRTLRSVDRADVVLILIDALDGITEQDKKIAGYVNEQGKASIIIVNKWDVVEKDEKTLARYEKKIKNELIFMQYAKVLFISALTGQRIQKIFDYIIDADEEASKRIQTSTINQLIREILIYNPPPTDKGRSLKILFSSQVSVKPPTFVLFVNDPELLHFSYKRHIENQIRESFGFQGTPIRIIVRKNEKNNLE